MSPQSPGSRRYLQPRVLHHSEQAHLLSSPIATGNRSGLARPSTLAVVQSFVRREEVDLPTGNVDGHSYSWNASLTSATFRWSAGSAAAMVALFSSFPTNVLAAAWCARGPSAVEMGGLCIDIRNPQIRSETAHHNFAC